MNNLSNYDKSTIYIPKNSIPFNTVKPNNYNINYLNKLLDNGNISEEFYNKQVSQQKQQISDVKLKLSKLKKHLRELGVKDTPTFMKIDANYPDYFKFHIHIQTFIALLGAIVYSLSKIFIYKKSSTHYHIVFFLLFIWPGLIEILCRFSNNNILNFYLYIIAGLPLTITIILDIQKLNNAINNNNENDENNKNDNVIQEQN
tara:strand:+ start:434 stop:1039 length:606 start_codon:yes stop_codon:yes gene_type:complete